MFQNRPRPPQAAVAGVGRSMFGGGAPGAGVRGGQGTRVGACCPAQMGCRVSFMGQDNDTPHILHAGESIVIKFTPWCNVQMARFFLPPSLGNQSMVGTMLISGCDIKGGPGLVAGSMFSFAGAHKFEEALIKAFCMAPDQPLEVTLIGNATIPAEGVPVYAAIVGCDDRLLGKGNQVQGVRRSAHTSGYCYNDDTDPSRDTVAGSDLHDLGGPAPNSAQFRIEPYQLMSVQRGFVQPSVAANTLITGFSTRGCDYRLGPGKVTAELFNDMGWTYAGLLDSVGCIAPENPLLVDMELVPGGIPQKDVGFQVKGLDQRGAQSNIR